MLIEGTAFKVHSGSYHVKSDNGDEAVCKLRGNLKKEFEFSTSSRGAKRVTSAKKKHDTAAVAVGDRVRYDPTTLMIEEILPRTSDLSRHSPSRRGQHTLVANLDQLFIVFAAQTPTPDLWLLDRFIVAAESANITPIIVVNKIDLAGVEEPVIRTLFQVYVDIGYRVLFVSARAGIGIDQILAALPNNISAFTGPSGVGKSRLLNTLIPDACRLVGDVGLSDGMGRHTTTSSELVPILNGEYGWIADTPGIRQLEFWQVELVDLPLYFVEFARYIQECRFRNCAHEEEAGCAVRAARDTGAIDERRYESYLRMKRPVESTYH